MSAVRLWVFILFAVANFVGFVSSFRIRSELIPTEKQLAKRQKVQLRRACLSILHELLYEQRRTFYKKKIDYNNINDEHLLKLQTSGCKPLRRKNVLHD